MVPLPEDAKLSLSGCAFSRAMNSLVDFAATEGAPPIQRHIRHVESPAQILDGDRTDLESSG